MTAREEIEADDDGLMVEMIRAGALAGAYGAMAREMPDASSGLMKMAEKHHRAGTWLMRELCERQASMKARRPLPGSRRAQA